MLLEDPAQPRVDPRLVEITEGGVHRSEDEQHPNTPAEQTVERFDEGRARDGWIRIVPSGKTKATPEGRPFHAEVLHEEPSAPVRPRCSMPLPWTLFSSQINASRLRLRARLV